MLNEFELLERSLRKRIDGINFTLIKSYESLNSQSGRSLSFYKGTVIRATVAKIGRIIKMGGVLADHDSSKVVIDLNNSLGVYLEIFFKDVDLFVLIQFKGSFFVKEDSFTECRTTMLSLIKELNGLFRLTTIDFAQDFAAKVDEIFPDPGLVSYDYNYCFKFKFRKFTEVSAKGKVETGYELSSSRYKLIVYDKLRENRNSKNLDKKNYYDQLYSAYLDQGVTRVELRLKQELCKNLSDLFYDLTIPEDDFINLSLHRFYNKHKLRNRQVGSKDQDFRRWPVNPSWEFVFSPSLGTQPALKTRPDFLYTTPSKNIEKILKQLIEVMANINHASPKEFLKSAIDSIPIEPILTKAAHRYRFRESSRLHLEKIKKEMLWKNRDLFNLDTGQLGIPITSPVERKPNENLDTY